VIDGADQAVLVTGAAGFVGAAVSRDLLAAGAHVVGVDNLNDYYDRRLKAHRLAAIQHPRLTFIAADIEDVAALEAIFASHTFRAVINLAARAGVRASIENPNQFFATNVTGNLHLLEMMRRYGVAKLVLASTSSLYAGSPMPFSEQQSVNQPISPYAASKKAAEVMAYTYHHLFGIDTTILRYFTVYGPAGRPDMSIFRFIQWIYRGQPVRVYGDGSATRDFTFVDDIARGTIAALRPLGYEIINLGGGQRTPLGEVIAHLERLLGRPAQVTYEAGHPADMADTEADNRKAAQLLGWRPQVDIASGLERSVAWFVDHLPWSATIET
jgi:nucleoside-diphosphate-sugar epimerase